MVAMGLLRLFLVSGIPRQYPWFMESPVSSNPLGPKDFYGIEAHRPLAQEFRTCTSILDLLLPASHMLFAMLTDILVDCLLHVVMSLLKNWTGLQCLLTSVGIADLHLLSIATNSDTRRA